jgi:transcriptional regulator with XRE-family HTH domain
MYIAERIRRMREAKQLSQGDVEKRTGLLRCYISRIENGHAVPAIETLEKICRALEVPMYQLFYDGEDISEAPIFSESGTSDWASRGTGKRLFMKLRYALSFTNQPDRMLLLHLAKQMAGGKRRRGH